MKTCNKCGQDKNQTDYYSSESRCKECVKQYTRNRHANIPQAQKDLYNQKRRDKRKEFTESDRNKERALKRRAYARRKDNMSEEELRHYKEYKRNSYHKMMLNISDAEKQRRRNNRNKYLREKYNTNNLFKIKAILRARLNEALKNNQKSGSAVRDLGCSVEFLKTHLESKFTEGMNWENHGEWHMDHIKPLASFNLENREELLKACHYSNLQPLWAEDNLSKGDKYVG